MVCLLASVGSGAVGAATQAGPWQYLGGLKQGCMRQDGPSLVSDFAALPDGRILVAGGFAGCGGVVSRSLAFYRPTSNDWEAFPSPAGSPALPTISRVTPSGSTIYVAGNFTSIAGVSARRIARWTGSAWSEVAGGVNGAISDMLLLGTDLYVAGSFTEAGGVAAHGIARFDGVQWHALGAGATNGLTLNGQARFGHALAAIGSDLYVAGNFDAAGGVPAAHIARWSGGGFSALGGGASAEILSLDHADGLLYAAGSFTAIGGVSANRVAVWDGAAWARLGSESANGTNTVIDTLAVLDGVVYVAGPFTQTAGQPINRMARFAGGAWSALPATPDASNPRLKRIGSRLLYTGSALSSAGSLSLSSIGQFDGLHWSALGNGAGGGLNGEVTAVLTQGSDTYVGGIFTDAAGLRVNRIARWDGTQWHALTNAVQNGVDGPVYALAWYQGQLYVGGTFLNVVTNNPTTVSARGLARWDGSTWHSVGPFQGDVRAFREWNGDLYLGGSIVQLLDGTPAANIVRWNGSSFGRLPESVQNGVNGRVWALEVHAGSLVVAGEFTQAALIPHARIARWNGTAWSTLGSGTDGPVRALALFGGELVAAGWFGQAGGSPAPRIARWNGGAWSPMTSSVEGNLFGLAVHQDTLITAGTQTTIDGQPNRQLSRWNGSSWSTYISAVELPNERSGFVHSANQRLWVGGPFAGVGDQASAGLLVSADGSPDFVFANGFE